MHARRVALLSLLAASTGCDPGAPSGGGPVPEASGYAGTAVCGTCHPEALAAWRGSHHDLAMQVADDASVLGDFDDASFSHAGVTSTFSRDGDAFRVRTDGPDGTPGSFEVGWVFGVAPLQQLLVPFPDGRIQALGVAWDSRPEAEGGQRWMHLYPDAPPPPGDPTHWTGIDQTWNHMCAECHVTGFRKGYDAGADRFASTFEEIDVGCEACHGPGAAHVAWARDGEGGSPRLPVALGEPGTWVRAEGERVASRRPARSAHTEVETCGRCHARRGTLFESDAEGAPLLETHRPALLEAGLYQPDGQILDEVYVWGSFLQSRMYARGVSCSDCHEPHGLALRAEGNALCGRCHAPASYDTPQHHHHDAGGPGSRCVDCHMPTRTYMVVDERHDHGFRVPRPDLAAQLGVSDPCGACHGDAGPRWAADAIRTWRGGREAEPHPFASVFHAAREGRRVAPDLARLATGDALPAIVRATALHLLGGQLTAGEVPALAAGAADEDALVRMAAAGAAEPLPADLRAEIVTPLLDDPVRGVRLEAARALADVALDGAARGALEAALAELEASHATGRDRPEAHFGLGSLAARQGRLADARRAFETALRLDPSFTPASANLADVLRAEDRDDLAEPVLRDALLFAPDHAGLHHALGLLQVRRGRRDAALEELRRSVELAPTEMRFAYVYAVALVDRGELERARTVLAPFSDRPEVAELLASFPR